MTLRPYNSPRVEWEMSPWLSIPKTKMRVVFKKLIDAQLPLGMCISHIYLDRKMLPGLIISFFPIVPNILKIPATLFYILNCVNIYTTWNL
jgi:hypothetical protein